MLTLQQVEQALPPHLKSAATQAMVDRINNAVADPILAEQIRDNYVSYTSVLKEGKFKLDDYLHAVKYVSYKLLNKSNHEAWCLTFPQRHAELMAKGKGSTNEVSPHVHAYSRGKLVNLIMEQTIIPSWVLNQHMYQEALNTQADLMINAKSEMVRSTAASAILAALAKPKEVGPLVNIDMRESSGMNELKALLGQVAAKQVEMVEKGVAFKTLAQDKIVEM